MIVEYKNISYRIDTIFFKNVTEFKDKTSFVIICKEMIDIDKLSDKSSIIFIDYPKSFQDDPMLNSLIKKLNEIDDELKCHTRITIEEKEDSVDMDYYLGLSIGHLVFPNSRIEVRCRKL